MAAKIYFLILCNNANLSVYANKWENDGVDWFIFLFLRQKKRIRS